MAVIGSPVDSTWVNPSSVALTGSELRCADSAVFAGVGGALGVRGGVTRHGDTSLQVTVNGSDVITVQAGACVIPGNAVGVGCYRTALPAAVSGSLVARDATNSRIDLVVFHQLDTDVVPASGGYQAQIETITGTPSATPGAPALPSQAIELARITVPATSGGSSTVDSSFRTYTAAAGGTIPVPTSARLPASAAKGQRAIALDTLVEYVWSGTAWATQPKPLQFASGTCTLSDGGTDPSTRTVTLPAGVFTTVPTVMLTPTGGAAATTNQNYWANTITTTSFVVNVRRSTTTSVTFMWMALAQ